MSSETITVRVPELPSLALPHLTLKRIAVTRSAEHLLGRVPSVVRWNKGIVAVDATAQDLVLYDQAGHFVKTLGGPGNTPGQFGSRLLDAVRYGSQLAVLDQGNRRVATVDCNGRIQEWLVPDVDGGAPGRLVSAPGGSLALASGVLPIPTAKLPAYSTVFSTFDGSTWHQSFVLEPAASGSRGVEFGAQRLMWTLDSAGLVVTSMSGEFSLRIHNDVGSVVRILRREWHPMPITEDDRPIIINAFRSLVQRSFDVVGRHLPMSEFAAALTLVPLPASYPPFVHLLSDGAGRFWLELPAHATEIAKERPGQLPDTNFGSGHWEVWDEAGHHLFDVRFPAPFVLMDVHGDTLAGATIDAEGRTVVAVYQLGIS